MYKVHLTKSFKKDAKALSQADRILSMQIIDILAKGEKLESKTQRPRIKRQFTRL